MAVTQYIGSRYVPLFADPIDWDITRAYEPLTIVYYQGNSYTSRQAVPTGIDVTNEAYWALTGNYNAQVEQYRREVQTFDGRITANAQAIADEVTARMSEDTAIRALITGLQTDLTAEESARETADTQIRTDFAAADTQIRTDFAAADTQIRTDFTAADTALGNRISTLENPTRYIACIGDSFGNESTEWPTLTANKTGYQLINRCTNEAGFTYNGTDGKTFIGQLQDIKANANFGNVESVLVYGGVNDFTMQASVTQMKNAITTFMNEYNAIGNRKPRLIFAFGNFGNGKKRNRAIEFPAWYTEIADWCRTIGVPVVEYVPSWLACSDTTLISTTDNLHPTAAGENVIASYMSNLINGTYAGVFRSYTRNYTGKMLTTSNTEVPGTDVNMNQTLGICNNKAFFKIHNIGATDVLANSNISGNTWYSYGTLFQSDSFWTSFGVENRMMIGSNFINNGEGAIATKVNTSTGVQNGTALVTNQIFNFGNGTPYWRCFGSIETARQVFGSWYEPGHQQMEYIMY